MKLMEIGPRVSMAASLKASEDGLRMIDQLRKKKGWNKDAPAWCDAANSISPTTLDRFWRRTPIRKENFVAICKAVGMENWESIVDLGSRPATPTTLEELAKSFVASTNSHLEDVDYTQLQNLLKARRWGEADKETNLIMLKVAGEKKAALRSSDIKRVPCSVLRTIDQLWMEYSNSHFGFTAQVNIWSQIDSNSDKAFRIFADKVGWRIGKTWLTEPWNTTDAPTGHLPSWEFAWSLDYSKGFWKVVTSGPTAYWYSRRGIISALASRLQECNGGRSCSESL